MTNSIIRSTSAATLTLFCMTLGLSAQDVPENLRAGAAEFTNSCGSCHGADARGAGFLTRVFQGINPGDLTQLAANNDGQFPVDRVFEVIDGRAEVAAHGEREMPVWGDRYWQTMMEEFGPDEFNEQRARNRVLEMVFYLQAVQE